MLNIDIKNETGRLKSVILGIADSFGGTPDPEWAYDPKSKEHIFNGTFPKEADLKAEMEGFAEVLKKHDVEVYRPQNIENCNQIFSRDIGFVIDNKFVRPNILEKRTRELEGIDCIVDQIVPDSLIEVPEIARMEGGDVMPWNEFLFIGYSEEEDFNRYEVSRTNKAAVDFLKEAFPGREVKAFELNKSDTDPKENALHLDCCFQPVGDHQAIVYKGGFKKVEDYHFLMDYFGSDNVIEIDREEMYNMCSNVFSISPSIVVSERNFTRLNNELRDRGFTVEEIQYSECAKMEGLLRCSTLPLLRL
ncbi:arginine deiminase family protein [Fulvivirgaceae bacterium BMA10]|uniref:arginine deiminase n=1 Tax=Splendidivirga corallicola TaxID=3051826 RepID=A0ABT8KW32_9BACT|nr:arginine deiminase family protein [Fulvivirgaceae bacterium BMA10]